MKSADDARDRLIRLMKLLRNGSISVEAFSSQYEEIWNFDLALANQPPEALDIFERVFNVAAFYSPVLEDRVRYPGFKSEEEVVGAVERALGELGEG